MTKFNFRYRKSVFTALLIALISAPMLVISCDKSLKESVEPQATKAHQEIITRTRSTEPGPGDFVFSKIHVTGNKVKIDDWSDDTYFADQYVVIRNNSNVAKSIAGVSFGFTTHWNRSDHHSLTKKGLDSGLVYVDCVYTFPANATDVDPGKEIILARTAKNHIDVYEETPGAPGVFDLSGANYEVFADTSYTFFPYYPFEYDNPNVPNMIITRWHRNDMLGYGVGYAPPILFKCANLETTLTTNLDSVGRVFGTYGAYGIPFGDIIDGVETGSSSYSGVDTAKKALPVSIDSTFILVPDFGENHVFVRKAGSNGKLLNTGNSANDFFVKIKAQPTYSSDNSN